MAEAPVDPNSSLISGLEGVAISYVKAQVLAQLTTAVPWLFGSTLGWLSNPIVGFLLDSILKFLFDKTIVGVSLLWIMIDVQYQVTNAEQATDKLRDILTNQEKYTAAQQKEVEDNFDEESVELIRIGLTNLG